MSRSAERAELTSDAPCAIEEPGKKFRMRIQFATRKFARISFRLPYFTCRTDLALGAQITRRHRGLASAFAELVFLANFERRK